ncbi:MAG: ABC transporter permease, partial [Plesiomonas shigelloides]
MKLFTHPIARQRWLRFKANKRGFWSLWLFMCLFILSLGAELIANDKPLLVYYQGHLYSPVLFNYTETTFGGDFETEADYRDRYIADKIDQHGWMLWPPIR